MKAWAREIKQNALLRWNGVYKFQQKINLAIETNSYLLKTAETSEELLSSFKLRHEVFFQEFQKIEIEGIDFDKFDALFDHLIIIDKANNKVIGTYRINCSSFQNQSYTEKEFNLDQIFELPGPHLELGRACVQKDHRRGTVLSLLWRGITEYMQKSNASILFGCTSLKINNANQAALVYKYLIDQGAVNESYNTYPTKSFKLSDFDIWSDFYQDGLNQTQIKEAEKLIPPLLKSYIKFGAKIASIPAFDKDFDCIDLLTLLKKEDMTNSLARKFQIIQ